MRHIPGGILGVERKMSCGAGAVAASSPAGTRSGTADATAGSSQASSSNRRIFSNPPKMRSAASHNSSSGWYTSTGVKVVGRLTEVGTCAPTKEFRSVDLPTPVEPASTATRGPSRSVPRARKCSRSRETAVFRSFTAGACATGKPKIRSSSC